MTRRTAPAACRRLNVRDDGAASIRSHPRALAASACRERVQALGRRLMIDSAVDGGTLLRIRDPAAPKRLDSRPTGMSRPGMTSVLIIDDHPIVLQGVPAHARRTPASTASATPATWHPATGFIAATSPDVVIVDLSMQGSGLGGLPLIRRIARTIRARAFSCSACTAIR